MGRTDVRNGNKDVDGNKCQSHRRQPSRPVASSISIHRLNIIIARSPSRASTSRETYMQMGNLPRLDTRPRLPPPPPSSSTTPPPSLPSFSIPPSSLRLRYRTRKQLPRSSIPDKRLNFHRQETPFQRTEEATLRRKGTLSRRMTR